MTVYTYDDTWQRARTLPAEAQRLLAENLMGLLQKRNKTVDLRPEDEFEPQPLNEMSDSALRALAVAVVPPERIARLNEISNPPAPEDEVELQMILDELDEFTLLKARAWYTLKLRGLETNESIHEKLVKNRRLAT